MFKTIFKNGSIVLRLNQVRLNKGEIVYEKIIQFLKNRPLKVGVLATCAKDARPWCAVVGYAVEDDLTLIFSTSKESRKWKNIVENPEVAYVVGSELTGLNVQFQGKAELIAEGEQFARCEKSFFIDNPEAARFKSPEFGFIKLKPRSARVTDFDSHTSQIQEFHV